LFLQVLNYLNKTAPLLPCRTRSEIPPLLSGFRRRGKDLLKERTLFRQMALPTPNFSISEKVSKQREGWSGLLERIHRPPPLSENPSLITPIGEPSKMTAE
jgi:hypothetical protein